MAGIPHPLQTVVRTDPRLRAAYSEGAGIYRIVPAAVALPRNITELRAIVRWAADTATPLVARGAGSGIPGSAVGRGVVVDLRERMPRELRIDAGGREALTSAGITQAELNRAALPAGLRLPPDPSSSAWATLGGMLATNAAGARTVRYGPARAWVQAADLVDGTGQGWRMTRKQRTGGDPTAAGFDSGSEGDWQAGTPMDEALHRKLRGAAGLIEARFPRVRKNTAGYALDEWLATGDDLDLVIGSEGTLGFVTAIRWRLQPIPAARSGLRIALASLDDLEAAVRAIGELEPSALELLDRTFLDLVSGDAGPASPIPLPAGTEAMLLVEFERESASAARGVAGDAVRLVDGVALDVVTALSEEEERQLWSLRHAASPILARQPAGRRSMQVIEDGCVPLPRLGDYVRAIREAARQTGIRVVIFGHAGDGHLHVNALADLDRPGWEARLQALYDSVHAAAIALGGTISGEHGDGRLRAPLLAALYGEEVLALFREVKLAFDPRGILNPGVKLPDGTPPLSSLKVGPEASPIPPDIAAALHEIERTGGYARSRVAVAEG